MDTIKDILGTFKSLDINFPQIDAPSFKIPKIIIPTEEEKNEYQSAQILIKNLASTIRQWRNQLNNDEYQSAILAILYGAYKYQ